MAGKLRIWRIYVGADGKSGLDQIDIAMQANAHGEASQLFSGKGVQVTRQQPGHLASWHPAPRRQLIATLSGEAEIETGDGQILKSRPGVIHLVEDVHGQGHITRVTGTEERVSVFMPLDEDTKLV
jgi:hypothetical protein